MPKNYLIRADASHIIGSGHVMRMIALGQMLQDEGQCVHFASITENEDITQRIAAEGFTHHRIEQKGEWESSFDAGQLAGLADELDVDWVILDGYHFTTPYQRIIKGRGRKLMCMDDIAQCHFVADLVVNQNINASRSLYSAEGYTKFILGPKNVMLRREYIKAKAGFKRRSAEKIENVLITMGGADPENVTQKVCEALEALDGPRLNIKVAVGALNRHYGDIVTYSRGSKNGIEVLRNVGKEMPELMKWANIGIFSAGSTIFEGLYLQLPLFCCLLASNQKVNYIPTTCVENKYKDLLFKLKPVMDFCIIKDVDVSVFNIKSII